MSDVRLLDYDPLTRQRQRFQYDPLTDQFTIVSDIVGIEPMIELASEMRKVNDVHSPWGDGQHVASIPATVADDLFRKGILQDEAALKRWLNDPDNRCFRTREGTI